MHLKEMLNTTDFSILIKKTAYYSIWSFQGKQKYASQYNLSKVNMYQIQYIFKSKKVHARVLVLLLRFPSLLFSAHLINCVQLIN